MALLLAKVLAIAVIMPGPCPATDGGVVIRTCAIPPNTIYLPTDPLMKMPGDREHELGHLIDWNFLTNADRGTFEYLTHQRRPWDAEIGTDQPSEQFAEAVRLCARSTRRPGWAGYGYEPSIRTHRRVCRWLATIGARP